MEARTPLRIDGEDSSETAGSSADSNFPPDDADGPTPYDYMAIVLAVAWLGPTVYYTVFGDGDALALDGSAAEHYNGKLASPTLWREALDLSLLSATVSRRIIAGVWVAFFQECQR